MTTTKETLREGSPQVDTWMSKLEDVQRDLNRSLSDAKTDAKRELEDLSREREDLTRRLRRAAGEARDGMKEVWKELEAACSTFVDRAKRVGKAAKK